MRKVHGLVRAFEPIVSNQQLPGFYHPWDFSLSSSLIPMDEVGDCSPPRDVGVIKRMAAIDGLVARPEGRKHGLPGCAVLQSMPSQQHRRALLDHAFDPVTHSQDRKPYVFQAVLFLLPFDGDRDAVHFDLQHGPRRFQYSVQVPRGIRPGQTSPCELLEGIIRMSLYRAQIVGGHQACRSIKAQLLFVRTLQIMPAILQVRLALSASGGSLACRWYNLLDLYCR